MLKNMSIGKRLAIGFGLIVLLLISMGLSGYWGLEVITRETLKVLEGDAKVVTLAARAKATTLELRRFEKDTFLNVEESQIRNSTPPSGMRSGRSFARSSANSTNFNSRRTTKPVFARCAKIWMSMRVALRKSSA